MSMSRSGVSVVEDGIAENVVFDLLRRKPKCVPLDPEILGEDDGENEICVHAGDSGAIEETEEVKLIREAIEILSPTEQTVIWAASQFYKRCTHQRTPKEDLNEIVEGLGVPPRSRRRR